MKLLRCKLGTQPRTLIVDGRYKIAVDRVIRVRERMYGSEWFEVKVDAINAHMTFVSYY